MMAFNSSHLLGQLSKGLVFVVSAPAGTGKTTLVHQLVKEFNHIKQSISFTTRPKRAFEQEGEHYHFISVEDFEEKIAKGEFLEYVKLYDDYYGTSKTWLEQQTALGFHVVLIIDTQGALLLMKQLNACFIFIKPPSFEALKQRLLNRQTETEETLSKRLSWAVHEMERAHHYQYTIINDQLEVAYQVLKSIIIAETHKN